MSKDSYDDFRKRALEDIKYFIKTDWYHLFFQVFVLAAVFFVLFASHHSSKFTAFILILDAGLFGMMIGNTVRRLKELYKEKKKYEEPEKK